MRKQFIITSVSVLLFVAVVGFFWTPFLFLLVLVGPIILLGLWDFFQVEHSVLRNFPVVGHLRYLFEFIRPEINQYFVESNTDGKPFNREQRSIVYQRAKKALDTHPFGTEKDVYEVGYEWVKHSLSPVEVPPASLRLKIGGPLCEKPYSASILNISAMSYGSLSKNAVMALNKGAKIGNFAHNTGEGGLSKYHLQGGDVIWQIGTAYFGCRKKNGRFDPEQFREKSNIEEVKMIELKLSQGAKPGHGGILPGKKLTREIADIRGVEMGKDVISPPAHSEFSTPVGLLEFIHKLRELSGGKPVGFKFCLGKNREFVSICKAMHKTGIYPDYIALDGGEGGTGAAPLEFSNNIGSPLIPALIFVHNCLVGFNLRDKIRVISSGKISTGFGIVKQICLGADMCYSARAMMFALGCIQALRCNTNHCPVGVTTQDPNLVAGLVVKDKKQRVAEYHEETIKSVAEIIGAMGISNTEDLRRWHLMRIVGPNDVRHYGKIYHFLSYGDLLKTDIPPEYQMAFKRSSPDSFTRVSD